MNTGTPRTTEKLTKEAQLKTFNGDSSRKWTSSKNRLGRRKMAATSLRPRSFALPPPTPNTESVLKLPGAYARGSRDTMDNPKQTLSTISLLPLLTFKMSYGGSDRLWREARDEAGVKKLQNLSIYLCELFIPFRTGVFFFIEVQVTASHFKSTGLF